MPSGRAAGALTAANAWCRSVNATNTNNFCLVNTNGSANNNNANNSWAVAPGFHNLRKGERVKCSRKRTGPIVKGEILPGQNPKPHFVALARTLLAWRVYCANPVSCAGATRFSRTPTPKPHGGANKIYDQ